MDYELVTNNINLNLEQAARAREIIRDNGIEMRDHLSAVLVDLRAGKISAEDAKAKADGVAEALDDMRSAMKKVVARCVQVCGFGGVVHQADDRLITYSTRGDKLSSYSVVSSALKALKAEIKARQEVEATASAAEDEYIIQIFGSAAKADKVIDAARRAGVEYRFKRLDAKESKAVAKIFTEA